MILLDMDRQQSPYHHTRIIFLTNHVVTFLIVEWWTILKTDGELHGVQRMEMLMTCAWQTYFRSLLIRFNVVGPLKAAIMRNRSYNITAAIFD